MAFFPTNFMLQTPNENDHHHQPPSSMSTLLQPCTPQHFHGQLLGKRSMSFQGLEEDTNEGIGIGEEDNLSDDGSQAGEKKRRLNMEQVKTLERNFEIGNKLEPERKMQLAKALGLQPRQVAIWFQNRRARCKTKQLEKDYDILRRQFDALKADNESLHAHNQKLQAQISTLKGREPTESINLNKETDQGSCSNRSENSSEVKLDISTTVTTTDSPLSAQQQQQHRQPTGSRAFFPLPPSSSATISRPNGPAVAQLFQGPPNGRTDLHCQKFDHSVKEESYTNMFCSIDDQPGFWPWIEQPNFN